MEVEKLRLGHEHRQAWWRRALTHMNEILAETLEAGAPGEPMHDHLGRDLD